MIINFDAIQKQTLPNFKGGEKEFNAKFFTDDKIKILHGHLAPGASIGMHTHETNCEVIYILEGEGTVFMERSTSTILKGQCHYCPKGCAHSLKNTSNTDLLFIGIIPEQ